MDEEFLNACINGDIERVKRLIRVVDPSTANNWAIRLASQFGHKDVVQLLLADPRVDPSVGDNMPILLASQYGKIDVVRLLLDDPRVDSSAGDNQAIRYAKQYPNVVQLLTEHQFRLDGPEYNKNIL